MTALGVPTDRSLDSYSENCKQRLRATLEFGAGVTLVHPFPCAHPRLPLATGCLQEAYR